MVDIIPGIFEKEWSEIEKKVALAAPYAEWVQIDFADGTLVPAMTFLDLGKFGELGRFGISLEAHLMVANPEKYIRPLADAGFKRIIAHVECNDPRRFLEEMQLESAEVGLAIDGPTELEVIEPFLESIDFVLVMMSEAGASGTDIQQENVEKVKSMRNHYPDLPIEVDEGINDQTIKAVKDAGANRFVMTSFIFNDPTAVGAGIEQLKNILG